ncbi:cytochrome c oxidase subunit 3 [Hyphomicrobium sulfonivorans]|uniref:cytochrome-c oxidase n=1 Tax=Hyphomicrobium sulfonivorans TaxID=121290 RepID=A0A120CUT7_HYPSL|nr:cytochrome c oxidase subunit 3 [Hyphomicrobium sulfonivorans]KWT66717.1 Cytochrome c oxidase polypeptide III [Hyphomicrobium sulfonivorans]MBI1649411.1 cytochrome c oxidase subunit 3 [Hyphomicrobium sulfonivorans]NSL71327.1 cytochrome c oxidase subunit 3 [Hyphomicrobium sulfonivorans]
MAASHAKQHDYHLVNPSPWPLTSSIAAFVLMFGAIVWMRSQDGGAGIFGVTGPWVFWLGFLGVVASAAAWWRDVIREGNEGEHTPVVQLHFRYGMILFIASEVMFFVAWFWAYFDVALFPKSVHDLLNTTDLVGQVSRDQLVGGQWPPVPVEGTGVTVPATGAATPGVFQHTFDPWGIPLLNTLILLASGVTVTWAHHAMLKNDRRGIILGLLLSVLLGMIFTFFQWYEYQHAAFSFAGHIYGATFFMATGFHGFHVIVGTIFLLVCLIRAMRGAFTPKAHFGFEAAAWYWHFVDVVWLFLFASIYVWGAGPNAGGVGH